MIELISLHIPKTAGVSFEHTLKSVYGEDVVRVNIKEQDIPKKLPKNVRVIHGHFRYNECINFYKLDKDVPVITWLRDPVERVISNYFYLQKVFRELITKEGKKGLVRLERSFIEFARADNCRNRMSKFLAGIKLSEFYFVGILEHLSEDLADLAFMLGWKNYQRFRHNISEEQRIPIDDEVKEEIKTLNEKDIALYEEALYLRKLRHEKLRGRI